MKYYIIAGEASGDLHGSNLMRAILAEQPDAAIRFWGGDRMAEVLKESGSPSLSQVRHIRDLAYMGFVEVLSHLGAIMGNISFCKRDIDAFKPDTVVFIDYPGFNLKIAKYTRSKGYRNVYYISPQIWAWKKNRIRPMRRDLDRLCYILPTERQFYAANNFPQAEYVGHPLLDEIERYRSGSASPLGYTDCRPVVALLPGSRRQELRRMLPGMVGFARLHPEIHFVVAAMSLIGEEFYRQFIPSGLDNVSLEFDRTYDILAASRAAIVCSGTATLETALFRVPQVVCYQCSRISAAIVRLIVSSSVKYISLVNIIADRSVVAELIQDQYNPRRLEAEFGRIFADGEPREAMLADYDRLSVLLGGPGASSRTARAVMNKE